MHLNAESVGCLLIGETMRMRALGERLALHGVDTARPPRRGDLLGAVQEGLSAARRRGGVCVAAEGEMWAPALSLAVQLCVDRVALIAPTDSAEREENELGRQIERLKGYVRRNLIFCVSEVLVLENVEAYADRKMEEVFRGLCNARVHRLPAGEQRWTNCEFSPIDAAARFLWRGECMFSLA